MKKKSKIYADHVEAEVMEQFNSAMEEPSVIKGALMPDAHIGYSLPIGGVLATKNFVYPSWVGYDIGCGVCALKTSFDKKEITTLATEIEKEIYRTIAVGLGRDYRDQKYDWNYKHISRTKVVSDLLEKGVLKQLGTLGSGNHFIEIDYDPDSNIWIVVHSGSRGFGHSVASHYMALAAPGNKPREGHYGFKADSKDGRNYIKDMNFVLNFAFENRKNMLSELINIIERITGKKDTVARNKIKSGEFINSKHNHAELKNNLWIHRKGATQAEKGVMVVIPGNMKDGSFIAEGKGSPEGLYSSAHGAGRAYSRKKSKRELSLDEFKKSMKGITARVTKKTIDESPMAYKDIFEVMEMQKDLIEINMQLKPIINIKGTR